MWFSTFNFEVLRESADSTAADLLVLPLFMALTRAAEEESLSPEGGIFVVVHELPIGDDKDDEDDGGGSGEEQAIGEDR